MTLSLLLVDHHTLVRHGIASLLQASLAGLYNLRFWHAPGGKEALDILQEHAVDVVLMDLSVPGMNSVDLCQRIRRIFPATRILGVSNQTDKRIILEFFASGAQGYVPKSASVADLTTAIHEVLQDRFYIASPISGYFVEILRESSHSWRAPAFLELTPREREVLNLLVRGNTSKEIAGIINVSTKTVEAHRKQIMTKTNSRSIAELVLYAVRNNLVQV
ncbi:response regulator [Spirochaeta lutea]|uniref:LuxR family transcriptional regulator n=1 Tax=Spirochaeta lutea TaxID=1480694 RepID=A0A098QXD2_9SPIO|nr:response regulator transcription factor [Spirochaeta lutea]KGE72221.1 hypothetical protein DC28_07505 [Spirochaeta lutea]